jgi:HD-like signal output (HDOD) protein
VRRILFVDDDPKILDGHRESLKKHRDQVDAMFAVGGEAALEQLRKAAIDVVVSDMHMPGMSGDQLLGRIKEDNPELVRIMLCSPTDRDGIFVALPVSHQVLSKPCDAETLVNSIDRAFRLRALLTDALQKRVGNIERLPSLPVVYQELMSAMSRADVSTRKISRIIEKDAAMAAKTLQLVNSACFGIARSITKLDQAVAYLGMELIRNLALTVHIFAQLEKTAMRCGFSFEAEQEHSLLTARVARRLLTDPRQAQDAFTAGLLHDIGNLVLAVCIPENFKGVIQGCALTGRPQHEIEAELLGVTHAEVGAYLLGLWGLPYPIVEGVAYHHNPSAALERTFDIPTAISVANALVKDPAGNISSQLAIHLESLKVSKKLPEWIAIAREELQNTSSEVSVR